MLFDQGQQGACDPVLQLIVGRVALLPCLPLPSREGFGIDECDDLRCRVLVLTAFHRRKGQVAPPRVPFQQGVRLLAEAVVMKVLVDPEVFTLDTEGLRRFPKPHVECDRARPVRELPHFLRGSGRTGGRHEAQEGFTRTSVRDHQRGREDELLRSGPLLSTAFTPVTCPFSTRISTTS